MALPRISVITVTWNLINEGRAEAIRAAIDCVQAQGAGAFEHVIWDGASTDGTSELLRGIADEVATRDGAVPIRLISQPDSGLYDAMNRAVDLAQGDYVVFLNSDDTLASDSVLPRAVAHLGDRQVDFLYGATQQCDTEGQVLADRPPDPLAVLQRMPFSHNSVFIRRSLFRNLGGHDIRLPVAADYDLVLRMYASGTEGEDLGCAISSYTGRGASGDDTRVARDYAASWSRFYAEFDLPVPVTPDACLAWYQKGNLPLDLCRALRADPEFPLALRPALKASLNKARRRALRFWKR